MNPSAREADPHRRHLHVGWFELLLLAVAVLVPLLLLGCTAGPAYTRPPVVTPDDYRGAAAPAPAGAAGDSAGEPTAPSTTSAPSLADRAWWELFGDPALSALLDRSLVENHELRLAALRVVEARAQAGIARAERFPAVAARFSPTYQRQSAFLSPIEGNTGFYDVNVGAAWELDLWGRVRRLNEAALARYLAREEAARGVRLSLVAEVATSYFRLRALDAQLDIARRTTRAFTETHDLFDARLRAGLASSLETVSAQALLAQTEATVPDLERRIAAEENLLSFLAGRNPGAVARGAALEDLPLAPEVPCGLPADLLERRPDLREAEQEMVAANADVGVATASYFPRVSLTGMFGGVSTELEDLFGAGKTWSVGAGVLSPVLQGGRLRNEKRAAVARFDQARVRYEQAVTNAFREVATALAAHHKLARVEGDRARAVAELRTAVELATTRYRSGLAGYIDVLAAQRQLLPAENDLAETRLARLAALVELYRALGGGWSLDDAAWTRHAALGAAALVPAPPR